MDLASSTQKPDHQALWARLQNHGFDPGFLDRLARAHLWPVAFAAGVLEEYRRFCFLAAVSPSPVTPSEEVDEVWHLHLTYSRDYWDIWCGQVLLAPLHHEASAGGAAALAQHAAQYAHTLALYEQHFGPPPEVFWPSAHHRFARRTRYRIADTRLWLLLPRPAFFLTQRRFPFLTR